MTIIYILLAVQFYLLIGAIGLGLFLRSEDDTVVGDWQDVAIILAWLPMLYMAFLLQVARWVVGKRND